MAVIKGDIQKKVARTQPRLICLTVPVIESQLLKQHHTTTHPTHPSSRHCVEPGLLWPTNALIAAVDMLLKGVVLEVGVVRLQVRLMGTGLTIDLPNML